MTTTTYFLSFQTFFTVFVIIVNIKNRTQGTDIKRNMKSSKMSQVKTHKLR